MSIKNIIFDLGGVLIKIDYNKTREAFINLGIKNFDEYYQQDYVSKLFEDLEIGKISSTDFYFEFRKITNSQLTNFQIAEAWNAMLGEFWIDRLNWLDDLKSNYGIFLFSNTNEIHYRAFIKLFENTMPNKSFSNYFIKDYYSHIMGERKPNEKSFKTILAQQNLISKETLFIDDTLKNIEGAKLCGLQTLHLLPNTDLKLAVIDCLSVQ